jgi:two-component system, LytTR family, sensor kinase
MRPGGPAGRLTAVEALPHSAGMKSPWPVPLRALLAAGVVYALFAASVSHWFTRTTGLSRWTMAPAGPAIEFANLFGVNLAMWCGWGALAIVIFALGRRVRFDRAHWARALAFHAVASVVVTTAHVVLVSTVRVALQTMWGLEPSWWLSVHEMFFRTLDSELPVYWALLGLQHAVDYHREVRARDVAAANLETRLMEAQLQALQCQLHPHFLFNTLHAIATLVHQDPDKADRMIERLSDLLRVTLDKVGVQEVPLAEELEYLQAYLDIVQIHFGDRLDVRQAIEPETLDALVPYLVLQPLVENAVRHGLEPRRGDGVLAIQARRVDDRLQLVVRDNGRGMSATALGDANLGVGVSNTRARLERLHPGRHTLAFAAAPGGGVAVTIELPFRPAPAPLIQPVVAQAEVA